MGKENPKESEKIVRDAKLFERLGSDLNRKIL